MSIKSRGWMAAWVTVAAWAAVAHTSVPGATPGLGRIEDDIVRLTNLERQSHGLQALCTDAHLQAAAASHSEEMAALQYFDHISPRASVRTVAERVSMAGGTDTSLGENLSRLWRCPPEQVASESVEAWLQSPTHRANLLDEDFNRIGVSVTTTGSQTLVTQVFSVRCIDVGEVQASGDGSTEVSARVLQGPLDGALFLNGRYLSRWQADPEGWFTIHCQLPRQGVLGVGQAADSHFKIVSAVDLQQSRL